jgi:hypothetical protein
MTPAVLEVRKAEAVELAKRLMQIQKITGLGKAATRCDSWASRDLIECMIDPTTNEAIEAVWRLDSTRMIAGGVRMVRDVGLAEDLAQDALVPA